MVERLFVCRTYPGAGTSPDADAVQTGMLQGNSFWSSLLTIYLECAICLHLINYADQTDATNKIRERIYVDNLAGTSHTVTELKEFHTSSKGILDVAGSTFG